MQIRPSSNPEPEGREASLPDDSDLRAAGDLEAPTRTIRRDWKRLAPFAFGVLLLALATLPSPRVPTEAESDTTADASWCAVLEHAHRQGWQFGTDIVFTYGPLGFLATPYTFSASIGARLVTDLALSSLSALGICLIARRRGGAWGIGLISLYLFLVSNIYPRADLLLDLSLLCWGILCIVSKGRNLLIYMVILAGIAAAASLIKITLLVMALLTIGVVSCNLLLGREYRLSLGLPALAIGGLLIAWVLAGQNLFHLGTFLQRAFLTSAGYNNAMAYEGSVVLRGRAILAGLLTVAALMTAGFGATLNFRNLRGFLITGWLIAMLLLVWKHGFVRTDLYHAGFFFGFAPILALVWAGLASCESDGPITSAKAQRSGALRERLRRIAGPNPWAGILAVSCGFCAVVTVQTMILPGDWKASLLQPFRVLSTSFSTMARPDRAGRQTAEALRAERERNQLPELRRLVGQSSVDMFGCEQLALLANNLNYVPRPVFQSYAAYSAPLMEWNERFYQSDAAPHYVVFRLMGMDRKLPALEDARLFLHLLTNYEPIGSEGSVLLLEKKGQEATRFKLLKEGTLSAGENINLVQFGNTNLWLEIQLKPSLLGKLRQLVYQPAKSRLVIRSGASDQERTRHFRAPAPMLNAGFLLSPLLLNAEQVSGLYKGTELNRPKAWSVEFNPGDQRFWQTEIRFRLYAVENQLGGRPGPGA